MLAATNVRKQTTEGEYIFSVRELNLAARDTLENHFQILWVSGEISNLSHPSSGHIYFSLKEDAAQIRCAWFRGKQGPMRFKIENGQQVIVRALVTVYPERGDYQLVVEKVELAGLGLLQQQLEALKRKLNAKGWFDAAHKKALPAFPETIGIITSATGAALHDVLSVLKRRAPFIKIRVYPCQVQGTEAPQTIIKALKRADAEQKCEVLLLTRGGGSLEDLWAFNDEALAEAIFNCQTPIVSAVGHEIDFSISDFVADVRAPTPSAAAELISPDLTHLLEIFKKKHIHLNLLLKRLLERYAYNVDQLARMLKHPRQRLAEQSLNLKFLREKLEQLIHRVLLGEGQRLQELKYGLGQYHPQLKIRHYEQALTQEQHHLKNHFKKLFTDRKTRFHLNLEKLEMLSPMRVLARGYAISRSEEGKVIDRVEKAKIHEKIEVKLFDGRLLCEILSIQNEANLTKKQ